MKKYLILFVFAVLSVGMLYVIGCASKGVPIYSTLGATSTPTHTSTITNTPGAATYTPTMTSTATVLATPWVIYNSTGGLNTYAGGTPNFPNSGGSGLSQYYNAAQATMPTPYTGDSAELAFGITAWGTVTYSDVQLESGSGAVDLSGDGYTMATFYACASTANSGGVAFYALNQNACAGCTYLGQTALSITTSWQPVTILFSSDSTASSDLASLTGPFTIGINNGVSAPITFYVDNIQYQ